MVGPTSFYICTLSNIYFAIFNISNLVDTRNFILAKNASCHFTKRL
nr:MAG TPA: hypothetical protein [Caudoviricetes sp.]